MAPGNSDFKTLKFTISPVYKRSNYSVACGFILKQQLKSMVM